MGDDATKTGGEGTGGTPPPANTGGTPPPTPEKKDGDVPKTEATKTEAPPVGDKKTDPPPAPEKPKPPEKYELKLPEKSLLQPLHVQDVEAFAKEKGLSQEEAQRILDRESNAVSAYIGLHQKGGAAYEAQVADWKKQAAADPELGGTEDRLRETAEHARRGLEKSASPALRELLEESGWAHHPEFLRHFSFIGRSMADDKLVKAGAPPGPPPMSDEELFYGKKG